MNHSIPLDIGSIKGLGWKLNVKPDRLRRLAASAPRHYRPYVLRRRGKARRIDNPDGELKVIQRRIHQLLAPTLRVDHLHGAVRGRSSKTNACSHMGRRFVVRLDISDFFPSISHRTVYWLFRSSLACSPPVASILTNLTTYRGYLPQGSPASSDIANLVLLEVDQQLIDACGESGLIYTRYIDDLVFSGEKPQELIQVAVNLIRSLGFRTSRRKLLIQPRWRLQEVTGFSVNGRNPGVPRQKIDAVRAAIHQLRDVGDERERFDGALRSIEGRIRYVEKYRASAGRRLRKLLEAELRDLCRPGAEVSQEVTSARNSAPRPPPAAPSR